MFCSESHQRLQQRLDGEAIADRGELDRHLADCPACRDLYASAQRLEECLQSLTSIAPPADLSQRIIGRWLEELRAHARRRRRLLVGVGVAAALLTAVFLGYSRWRPKGEPETGQSGETASQDHGSPRFNNSPAARIAEAPAGASLNQSVEEASAALVALLNRTADETVGQGKVFLPATMPPPLPAPDAWQQSLDPPVESLREAQQNVTAGLEPVTSSARRAVNLFLREMPQ